MTAVDNWTGAERRRHPRVPITLRLHCKRLGFPGVDEEVDAVDLSMSGVRFFAPTDLGAGDVVALVLDPGGLDVSVRGLVVHTSRSRERPALSEAHVAFTGVTFTLADELSRLVTTHDPTG